MFLCSTCPRATCREHFPDHQYITEAELAPLTFRCMSCHLGHQCSLKKTPEIFWVRKPEEHERPADLFLKAFFRKIGGNLVPAFESNTCHFDRFSCDNHRGVNSQVDTSPVTCINYCLDTLPLVGSPGYSFVNSISPYWVENPAALQFLDVPFSVSTKQNATSFRARVDAAVSNIAR